MVETLLLVVNESLPTPALAAPSVAIERVEVGIPLVVFVLVDVTVEEGVDV